MRSEKECWTFPLVSDEITFQNCQHIHPLKQRAVQDLVDQLSLLEGIEDVVIFGSSVEFRCNSYSDLDVCIDGSLDRRELRDFLVKYETDLFFKKDLSERMRQEIEKKGISVWR